MELESWTFSLPCEEVIYYNTSLFREIEEITCFDKDCGTAALELLKFIGSSPFKFNLI
jgi:hypothetical protein